MVENILFSVLKTSLIVSAVTFILFLTRPFILKKRTAKWLYFLFFILFVRLILPFDITLPDGGFVINVPEVIIGESVETPAPEPVVPDIPITEPSVPEQPPVQQPDYVGSAGNAGNHGNTGDIGNTDNSTTEQNVPVTPVTPEVPDIPVETPKPEFSVSLFDILGAVYIAGLSVFVLCQIVCYFIMIGTLNRNSEPCTDPLILETSEKVRSELGIKRNIPVKICSVVSTPTLAGLIRPVLLFPENCNDPNYLSYIFRHEYMHYKYGDLYFKILALAANAVHWFNPMIYLLRRESEKVVEFVCDSRVVGGYDGKFRSEYCNAIVDEVERSVLGRRHSAYMTTSFTGNKKTLKERLSSILDTGKKRKGIISFVAIILVVAVAGIVVSCNVGEEKPPKEPIDYKTPIPENVVIDPVFEYAEVDPENYNAHITTGDGELIDKLYSYIHKPYTSAYAELVYRAEKVDVENIDSYLMLMTVYNTFGTEGLETRRFYNEYDETQYKDYYIYPQQLMDERIKIIFGEDAEVEHGTFHPGDYFTAEYFADEHFYRVDEPWMKTNDRHNYYEYLRYEEKGKYIYIYENYYCDNYSAYFADGQFHKGYLACSLDDETMFDRESGVLPEYKHTFKKDKNGEYHWVSTELVTDLEPMLVYSEDNRTEDEKLIDELYDYILKEGYDVVYRSGTTTVEELSDTYMLEVVHGIYGTKGLRRVMEASLSDHHSWSGVYFSDHGWEDNVLFVVPEELMEERIRAVFGENATVQHQSYYLYNSNNFGKYSAEDKCYYLGYDGGLGGDPGDSSKEFYLGYENNGDEFIIYDKYACTPAYKTSVPYAIYRDCEQKDFVSVLDVDSVGNFVEDHSTVYKHTFKKAADGSYYWFSTEQATADNGISEKAGETYVISDIDSSESLARRLWNEFNLSSICGDGYEPYTSVKYEDTPTPYAVVSGSEIVVFALKKDGSENAYGFWFDEENGEYSLKHSETVWVNLPEYSYSYADYEAYKNGDESKFDSLAYICGQYLRGYEYYDRYSRVDYAMTTLAGFCVKFETYGVTYIDFRQFDSLWDSESSLYLDLRDKYDMKYDSGYLYFPIGAMVPHFDSVYNDSEIISIEHNSTTPYGVDFADVILKTPYNGMYFAKFIFDVGGFRIESLDRYYIEFDSRPEDFSDEAKNKVFAEELYEKFELSKVLQGLNLHADHEFYTIVEGEENYQKYIDVYYRFYEHFFYTTPFAVFRFNEVKGGYHLESSKGVQAAPDGVNTQITEAEINSKVEVEEIPESVFIDPAVTYGEFDGRNYTPHLDTGNGELINRLYSFVLRPFRSEFMELVYQDEKVTVETLDDYIKQMTVFAVFGVEGLEVRTEVSSFGDEREYLIYPAKLMDERAKIIYGDDVTIDHFTFYPLYYHTAEYVPDGEYYRLPPEPFPWENQDTGVQMNFSEFLRYEENGEYIYIYDRFYTTEEGGSDYDGNIYACSAGDHLIAEKLQYGNYRYKDPKTGELVVTKGFDGASIPEYKHTFMKDENGNYHWVSTEPVTDISAVEIELGSEFTNPDDILAEKLYGYLMKYDYYGNELVYQSGKITQEDISDYLKRYTVDAVFGLNGLDREMSGALLQDSYMARVKLIYPAELMEKRVRQIFGPGATVKHESGAFHDGGIVEYSEEDRCYYFSAFDGGGDSPNCNYIYYIRHENKGDEFVIYDKYVYMTADNGVYKYYRATEAQDFITQTNANTPEQYATVYKHTFKKAADGSYYWYSTEQATADNGISEEVGETYVVSDSGTVEDLGRKLFEDYASKNSLKNAEFYAAIVIKDTFVNNGADLVVFYLENPDDFAALYFKENNGEYQFVREDLEATYRREDSVAFKLYGLDWFEYYNTERGDDSLKYKYAANKIAYQAGALESEGILYINGEDFYKYGDLPPKTQNIVWNYCLGYVILPKQDPMESIFDGIKIEYEAVKDSGVELIFVAADGNKYRSDIRDYNIWINRYYDDFEYMPEDMSNKEKNLLFVKELYEEFGDEIQESVERNIKGDFTFKAITKEVRYLDYEDYYLYFAADDHENCFYEYAYVYFRIFQGGICWQGGSPDYSLNVGNAYIYSKAEVDAVLGDINVDPGASLIVPPSVIDPEAPIPVEPAPVAPVPVEPVAPEPAPVVPEPPAAVDQSNEALAEKLYQYIVKHDDCLNNELVYREGVTYESDLSDHLKSYTVYAAFGLFGKELPRVGQYEEDSKLTAQGYSWAYDEFEYELYYRRIFGPDAEINHADFRWGYSLYGVYSAEDRCYYITRQGGGDDWKLNYTYYIGCENNGDEFIIYDKYVYVDSIIAPYNLYKASNGKGFITQINDENFEQYATVYKHTFKKTGTNSYYWYSTEQIKTEPTSLIPFSGGPVDAGPNGNG
ncbi:MAG: M56 family metallopeptidase [Ruminococcaceae bacterium]|nr:M56 family metallopeptidase [Oscillospiraceae bacterium]